MANTEDAKRIIEATMHATGVLSDARLLSVVEVEDPDGQPILMVRIQFPGRVTDIDFGRLAQMNRILRQRLFDAGDHRFPVFSYHALADMDMANPEAA